MVEHDLHPSPPETVRLFVRTTDRQHRQFLQFRARGDDIYWGPPGKGQTVETVSKVLGNAVQLTIANVDDTKSNMQVSYHASGQLHLRQGGSMVGRPMRFSPPRELTAPIPAGIVWTAVPTLIPPYKKVLVDSTTTFDLNEVTERRRLLLELFFSPAGRFEFPRSALSGELYVQPPAFSLTVSARLIVSGWVRSIPDLADWHPDKALYFVGAIDGYGAVPEPASDPAL